MEFFNSKEDVLDIQLTQFGKHLLSKGQFRPKYYSFFDDDILYDITYASGSEGTYETHSRIKDQTIRPKAQYLFNGAESDIRRQLNPSLFDKHDAKRKSLAASLDQRKAMLFSLGTSSPTEINTPRYEIYFAKAPISSSAISDTVVEIKNIPQIEVDHKIETRIGYIDTYGIGVGAASISPDYASDHFFYEEEEFVFLDVKELNQFFEKENFDIEVFEYITEEAPGGPLDADGDPILVERLRQLTFLTTTEESLKYASAGDIAAAYPKPTQENVEYYFNINVDEEIDDEVLCQVHIENKSYDIFADSVLEFECVDAPALDGPEGLTNTTNNTVGSPDYYIEPPEDPC